MLFRLRTLAHAGPSRLAPRLARLSSTSAGEWELVVGLEIHAQIRTGRKLFSREFACAS